jgi:hypothetical protein
MSETRGHERDVAPGSAALVHNLRNQVGLVVGFLDLLLEATVETDPRRADLLIAQRAACEVARLVASLPPCPPLPTA